MAAGSVIGALRVVLGADIAQYEDGMKRAEKGLNSFGRRMSEIAAGIGLEKVIEKSIAHIVGAMKEGIAQADQLGKMAQKFGVPVEQLSALKHAADLSDVSIETLGKSLGILSKNMNAVASGAKNEAAAAFSALGVSVTDASGNLKSNTQVLTEIAGKFGEMEDGAGKTALAMAIFGRAGAEIIPLLNEGKVGLQGMIDEARALGLVITKETSNSAQAFRDNLTRLHAVQQGIVIQVSAGLLPGLQRLSQVLIDAAKNNNLVQRAAEGFSRAIMLVVDNLHSMGIALGILVATKITGFIVQAGIAFVLLAKAIAQAGIAATLLNAVKKITIARIAAFGAIIIWATGNMPAFIEKLKEMGDTLSQLLPDEIGGKTIGLLKGIGINVDALTKDFETLSKSSKDTEDNLKKLNKPPPFSAEAAASAKKFTDEITRLGLQTRVLRGDFSALAPGFVESALGLKLIKDNGEGLSTTVGGLSPKMQQLNDALLMFKGAQITAEVRTEWEQYNILIAETNDLLAKGAISAETAERRLKVSATNMGATYEQLGASLAGSFSEIAGSFGKESSTMAKTAQILGAVQALISTYVGAAKTLELPFPFNLAAYAAILAKGLAVVASIRSTNVPSFAGGGSFRVPGGESFTDNRIVPIGLASGERVDISRDDGPRGRVREVVMHGLRPRDLFTGERLREMFEALNEGARDGYKLRFAT